MALCLVFIPSFMTFRIKCSLHQKKKTKKKVVPRGFPLARFSFARFWEGRGVTSPSWRLFHSAFLDVDYVDGLSACRSSFWCKYSWWSASPSAASASAAPKCSASTLSGLEAPSCPRSSRVILRLAPFGEGWGRLFSSWRLFHLVFLTVDYLYGLSSCCSSFWCKFSRAESTSTRTCTTRSKYLMAC